jgi:ATP phosphoribosyltransferase
MSEQTNQLRLGIPKGSLQETTQKLFVRAGYRTMEADSGESAIKIA